MVRLPVRCVWVATANNPRLSTEMIRRSVRIRMDSGQEQPWLRETSTFTHPDLRAWVDEHRAELVGACLTIVRAWIVAGRPAGPATLGMFESWAKTMSGILQFAGVKGFLTNTEDFYSSMAEDDQNLAEFVSAWAAKFQREGRARRRPDADRRGVLDLGHGSDRSQSTVLGTILRENRDRRFGDLTIRRAANKSGPGAVEGSSCDEVHGMHAYSSWLGRSTMSTDLRVYTEEVHGSHRACVDLVDLVDLSQPTQRRGHVHQGGDAARYFGRSGRGGGARSAFVKTMGHAPAFPGSCLRTSHPSRWCDSMQRWTESSPRPTIVLVCTGATVLPSVTGSRATAVRARELNGAHRGYLADGLCASRTGSICLQPFQHCGRGPTTIRKPQVRTERRRR